MGSKSIVVFVDPMILNASECGRIPPWVPLCFCCTDTRVSTVKNVDTVMGHDKQQLVRRLLLYASPCTPRLCCDGAAVLVLVHRFTEMQTFSLKALAESAVLGLRVRGLGLGHAVIHRNTIYTNDVFFT